MTTCPETGTWRAWIDDPVHHPGLEQHLLECAACQAQVATLRDNATVAAAAFGGLGGLEQPNAADVSDARLRLKWRRRPTRTHSSAPAGAGTSSEKPFVVLTRPFQNPWRITASAVAAALIVSFAVAWTPEGRAVAAQFLAQFRSRQIAVVEVSAQSQNAIMDTLHGLSNLGTLQAPAGSAGRQSAPVTLAEASQRVGFQVKEPSPSAMPSSVAPNPTIRVMPSAEGRFTFSKAKAAEYLRTQGQGQAALNLPDRFDGATLIVQIPSAAVLEYSAGNGARDMLVIGQAGELVVSVQGNVTLEEMREFLISLPGLTDETKKALRQMADWQNTLPLPVPIEKVSWQKATLAGVPGVILNDKSGVGSAALWQNGGRTYGLMGTLRADELQRVADGLR